MQQRLVRQLTNLGLSEDLAPDLAEWRVFLDRVRHAYREADQDRDTLERIAGGIAHEFNNILAVILGDAELALDALADDHPARADVQEIEAAGRRAALLTQQLLTFGRPQPCRSQVHPLDVAVTDKVRDSVQPDAGSSPRGGVAAP